MVCPRIWFGKYCMFYVSWAYWYTLFAKYLLFRMSFNLKIRMPLLILRMLLDNWNWIRHCRRSFRLYSILSHCRVILYNVFAWRCVDRLNHIWPILLGLWWINLKSYLICIIMNNIRSVSRSINLKMSIANKSGFTTHCSHWFIDNDWITALSGYQSRVSELIWLIIKVLS